MVSTFNNLYSFRCWLNIVSLYDLGNYFTIPHAPQKTHSHSFSFCSLISALRTLLQAFLYDTKGSSLVLFNFFTISNCHLNIYLIINIAYFF